MKIAIIGAGKWGSALCGALSEKNECVITSRTPRDLPNFVSIEEALDCEMLVFVIAAQHTAEFLAHNFTNKNQKILVASKGIEASSGKFLNEIFERHTSAQNLAYLSGPSFASEVTRKLPCALVVSSTTLALAEAIADLFPPYMKTYASTDVIGAEICGAYKNVIAIASGICDGLGLGNNARASLIARGIVEIARFGKFFGAQDDTFLGLSGVGDLFLTASSELSRNYRVGLGLAKNKSLEQILNELGEVAEGVYTARAVEKIAKEHGIYTPISSEVNKILNGKNVKESLQDLLKKH
ncbi:NAD(P)H-dependent glycerol-3-phosphate dehydrogenase [Campylobacter sp. JMF_01 NE2]|uniref:NAD(P)H-dependent glycerol-3-phosphate dehydrogenase n=1 Tax=unclassified Campylobacter TaxID=2593542 RepID=UPI0022E9E774|nr:MULTISPECIES: NAD(P)H-dependent glycerol-3-phosphate dehydrogenase [unclassified Campylobacter]MDA3051952.1 NAD(P)H-dependent glycerol-3-phosphate dehydrogenase [Campylobacter sp. JMF_03 NE3]MDA3066286.1 NAD(P)H-dependent glycerol-3-phosphate dehydrogenase [Campylobacter sp. JMF_01 NE2]